jgi:hypothetical protein
MSFKLDISQVFVTVILVMAISLVVKMSSFEELVERAEEIRDGLREDGVNV